MSNTIENLNAKNVINGGTTNWSLIELQTNVEPRSSTLVAQIDDNEIAILGG